MAYKMKGFSGFKGSPAKQKKVDRSKDYKGKGKMQGPIPEQNLPLQPGENDGTWIYGRGYEGEDPKEGIKEMKATEKRLNKKNKANDPKGGTKFVRSERMGDYDERAGVIEQNDLQDDDWFLGGAKPGDSDAVKKKAAIKGAKKRKQLKATIKTLDREQQIMRDRTDK
tara:strand:+ start:40 stop:543 length:504 start_codon:yes stop_codon:yes gene_type:complete